MNTSTAFYEVIERRWPRGVPEDRVVDPVTCPFGRPVGRQLMPHFSPETRAALARVVQTCAGQRATPDALETLRVMIASAIERERPDLTFRFRMDDPGDILVIWRYRPTPRCPMSTVIRADPKPSVTPDLIERFRVFHARNPHLFYVLTSGNIDHGTAALTLDRANESQDSEAIDLADLVVRMSKTQRYKLVCALNRGRP